MIDVKICGVKNFKILNFLINHRYPPKFIGFITNYKKSNRYLNLRKLSKLVNIDRKRIFFVSVMVNPDNKFLEKIKKLKFDYYQLYNVTPKRTKIIKKKYKVKIITAITVENINDVNNYKNYENISEIILFDGKGYEKSIGFNHNLLINIPKKLTKMIAGNIRYNDKLDNLNKIADIVDISGGLETFGEKDASKINIFLKNIKKLNDKNKKKNSFN
tara:strand:- start:326 stop:973 length:648 start_codon:yes stop_codon:yes gene_type:complete